MCLDINALCTSVALCVYSGFPLCKFFFFLLHRVARRTREGHRGGLFHFIHFRSGKQETSKAEVLKVRNVVIPNRLAIGRLLSCSLYISQETIRVYTILNQSFPCFFSHWQIFLPVQCAIINPPGNAIYK